MSNIKYRVWCKNRNEWEKNSCFISRDGTLMEIRTTGELRKYNEQNHIVTQFTGLKDKNGKEIFEGDIIEGGYLNPMTEKFESKKYLVNFSNGTFEAKLIGHSPYGDTWLNFVKGTVIGNIFENTELVNK